MHTKLEYVSETKAKVIVRISNVEILPRYVEALEKANLVTQKNGIVGIKNQYSDYVKRDLCSKFVKDCFPQALKDLNVAPLSQIKFVQTDWDEKADFEFSGEFEVKPKISAIHWNGIEAVIDYTAAFATETMINDALKSMVSQKQKVTVCPRSTVAQMGHFAMVDVDATYQGKPFLPSQTRGLRVEISPEKAHAPLQKGIIGKKVGEEFSFDFLYPADYLEKQLAGKKINFTARVVELHSIEKPEMNDAFVAALFSEGLKSESHYSGTYPRTVAELSAKLKLEIEFNLAHQKFQYNRSQIFKFLMSNNDFEIPKSLLQQQLNMLIAIETKEFQKNHSQEQVVAHLRKLHPQFLKVAEELVRTALIVEAVAIQLRIKCGVQDFEKFYDRVSRLKGVKIEFIKKSYENPKLKPQVAYSILEDKVVEHFIQMFRGYSKVG